MVKNGPGSGFSLDERVGVLVVRGLRRLQGAGYALITDLLGVFGAGAKLAEMVLV